MGTKVATVIVVVGLLMMAGVGARADASSTDRGQTDLSSLPAIEAYLTSIGVDPGSVVIQQGPLNYAGPFCPGDGWNCTAATRVVQIASSASPAANIFDCLPSLDALIPALNECLVVQSSVLDPLETSSSMNSASCNTDLSDSSGKSKCTIRQQAKKGNNNANVNQRINQRGGSPQTATEDAEINQTSDTGKNTATIRLTIQQTLDIDSTPPVSQQQQARQTAKVTQTAGGGNNSSDVQQTILQAEDAQSNSDITQDQNTDPAFAPNQKATVTQTTSTGANTSNLQHQLTQRQHANSCTTCTITQNQGLPFPGGQSGSVTQTAGGVAQNSIAGQNESQTQDAGTFGTLIRTKFGPEDCCTTQNGGTAANNCQITQSNDQAQTPTANPSMNSEQKGTAKEDVVGANCTLDQTYTANGVPHHHTETAPVILHDRFCSADAETNSCSDEFF